MRKFKLIKNFCDSGLQEGDIITFPEGSNIAQYKRRHDSLFLEFTLSEITKYTENWEEITETKTIKRLPDYWFVVPETEENLKFITEYCPKYKFFRISNPNNAYSNLNKVLQYHTDYKTDERLHLFTRISMDDFRKFVLGVEILLSDLSKVKKPLFTTEDGVDIFEGDTYWWVTKLTYWCNFTNNVKISFYHDTEKYWYFSTKEAAEEYILMNKPCLSLNDVFKVYPKLKRSSNNIWTKHALELKELVKSKL